MIPPSRTVCFGSWVLGLGSHISVVKSRPPNLNTTHRTQDRLPAKIGGTSPQKGRTTLSRSFPSFQHQRHFPAQCFLFSPVWSFPTSVDASVDGAFLYAFLLFPAHSHNGPFLRSFCSCPWRRNRRILAIGQCLVSSARPALHSCRRRPLPQDCRIAYLGNSGEGKYGDMGEWGKGKGEGGRRDCVVKHMHHEWPGEATDRNHGRNNHLRSCVAVPALNTTRRMHAFIYR